MLDPENKLRFDRWCDAFGIEAGRRDRLWSIMLQAGMAPDDAATFFLGAAGLLEKVLDNLEDAKTNLPALFATEAKRAIGSFGTAINRNWNVTLIAGAAVFIGAGYWLGHASGSADVSRLAADIAIFAKRTDAATWLQLMATTPDLTGSVEKFCTPESPETFKMLTGRQACGIWFWMDGNASPQLKSIARGVSKTATDTATALPWYLIGGFWMAVPFAIRWALKKLNAGNWLEALSKALKN